MTDVHFTFDGNPVVASQGQSLASALTGSGIRTFRKTSGNQPRGLFCGMGVCQDCLVTVDGVPNQRACMTKVGEGIEVATQTPFPVLDPAAEPPESQPSRLIEPDVLVIGGGAGGLSAAISARQAGARVTVLDERNVGGGQYYKQSFDDTVLDPQQRDGARLLAKAAASGAEIIGGADLWGAFDGPLFLADLDGTALIARPKTVIVATGAFERPIMVPGWTLPGVMTTGAAQTLWRSYRTLPGRRVIVCGSGPLNFQVALELAEGGADIRLVAETAPTPFVNPLSALGTALAGPKLTWTGISMIYRLRRRHITVGNRLRLEQISSCNGGLEAQFTYGNGRELTVETDVVCMNQGFEPQNEILRLLGAKMTYDPMVGHLRCDRSSTMETSEPGVFAVGDCAGLGGAPAALIEGRIAGLNAAAAAGHGDGGDTRSAQHQLRSHRRFQRHLWALHDIAPRELDDAPPEMILCRCEEVTIGEAIDGYNKNPGHLGTLKRCTRIGMGRCQGRYCGAAAARLIAEKTGKPLEDRSFFAPRVPIKPIPIASILTAHEALNDPN